ncbi:MAG: hypothetical protein OEV44_02335 [Spirochaetota bacterium]|nr:hypothetical protein [Spirochaetota bacterium]
MYKKKFIFLTLFLSLLLLVGIKGFTQVLDDDYDRREKAVDPFEDEDKLLREHKIQEIIDRIKRGDQTVLRLVVFDTFEAVHDELVRRAYGSGATGKDKYYAQVDNGRSIPAFIGGFDNQDPKVRLKCIGYLGDWVDEIGKDLKVIEKAVDRRLATNVETRKEVRYGYRILKMKIVRRKVISALKRGDKKVLVRITPEEFLPLVFYEPRIRTIYLGSPGAVRIRSIVLDPGIEPETGALVSDRPGRATALDIERICYQAVRDVGDTGEVAQWLDDVRRTGGNVSIQEAAAKGGYVGGGSGGTDTMSSDDAARTNRPVGSKPQVDSRCVKAIFAGLDNKSLFVREHSARIFLNYTRGWTGDANYVGDTRQPTRELHKDLASMARDPYYVRLAQVAWDNVKWSEYYYSDRVTSTHDMASFISHKNYMEYGVNGVGGYKDVRGGQPLTSRFFTGNVQSYPEWATEVSGNYRNDVKEVLRILGLSWYVDAEYVIETGGEVTTGRTRVDALFNDKDRPDRPRRPDRSDRLEGESDQTGGPQH